MRHTLLEMYSKRKDVLWTIAGVILISTIAFLIRSLGAVSVATWSSRHWILLLSMLSIALICTLSTSSDFSLIIQLYTGAIVFFLGMNDLRTEILVAVVVAICSISVYSMKSKMADLMRDRLQQERKLKEALEELKQVDEMKDEVIFVASHDLRTPLSIIKLNLATIREGYAGKVNKEAQSYVDAAYRAAERLGDLLEDLLEASVVEHTEAINIQPVQLEEVVHSVVKTHASELKHVRVKVPRKPYRSNKALADQLMIYRAIENIIINSAKYTRKGSITITVETLPQSVKVTIRDTGIGIPAEAQKRLFTKFYRAPNALNIQTRGTGLGLYITKQIIQRLRGTIWLESEINKGTAFFFELPKAKA